MKQAKDGTTLSAKEIKITLIEKEYNEPIISVLRGYAISNSYTFTCNLLGFHNNELKEYQYLFEHNFRPEEPKKPAVSVSNRRRADKYDGKTLLQWSKEKGIAYNTLRHRVKNLGWKIDKAVNTPPATRQQRGNAAHFNTERVRENRKQMQERWYQ